MRFSTSVALALSGLAAACPLPADDETSEYMSNTNDAPNFQDGD